MDSICYRRGITPRRVELIKSEKGLKFMANSPEVQAALQAVADQFDLELDVVAKPVVVLGDVYTIKPTPKP